MKNDIRHENESEYNILINNLPHLSNGIHSSPKILANPFLQRQPFSKHLWSLHPGFGELLHVSSQSAGQSTISSFNPQPNFSDSFLVIDACLAKMGQILFTFFYRFALCFDPHKSWFAFTFRHAFVIQRLHWTVYV